MERSLKVKTRRVAKKAQRRLVEESRRAHSASKRLAELPRSTR